MKVLLATFEVYEPDGSHNQEQIQLPTWDQVRACIEDLDGNVRPGLYLWQSEMTGDVGKVLAMWIYGGAGRFAIECSDGKFGYHRFIDRTKGTEEVLVWSSDQGFAPEERYVCFDFEQVLKIAKHYCETGQRWQEVDWERH